MNVPLFDLNINQTVSENILQMPLILFNLVFYLPPLPMGVPSLSSNLDVKAINKKKKNC